ncbi:hypothetical protein [Caulobacter sp. Root655]|uniref:hypothetical protein n=1 Tax=Caulobacter sp. Root655 TaxID=1736578 RepID=UPI001F3DB3BF|nr:hypothetical protein [Caulobacter sp. Root655]
MSASVLALCLLGADLAQAQSLPTVAIPKVTSSDRPNSEQAFAAVEIHERPKPVPLVFEVSPRGSDAGDGSTARPFASLARAQAAVRELVRLRQQSPCRKHPRRGPGLA